MVSLDNLVDLVLICVDHGNAANQTFFVSDDDDLSTSDLVRLLSTSMGKKALLLNIPVSILRICAGFVGKSTAIDKLCDSLQVDIQFTKDTLKLIDEKIALLSSEDNSDKIEE